MLCNVVKMHWALEFLAMAKDCAVRRTEDLSEVLFWLDFDYQEWNTSAEQEGYGALPELK